MSRRNNHPREISGRRRHRGKPRRAGKIRYGLAAWLLGLPLPFILLALFWGGCDF